MNNTEHFVSNNEKIKMLGYGLLKLNYIRSEPKFKITFQKGMGVPLIQNILELYKQEIIDKKQGNSIISLDNFTIFIHYFKYDEDTLSLIIYMEEKERSVNLPKLYYLSKKINKGVLSNVSNSELQNIFEDEIVIPRETGIIAVFILGATGSPYISKINKKRSNIADHEIHIGGFLSALLSFSNTIIGEETGAKLKEINFGNQQFYVISKNEVIFAFLVENMTSMLQRYMYLITEEFILMFEDSLKRFNGDVTPFNKFEKNINQYFII